MSGPTSNQPPFVPADDSTGGHGLRLLASFLALAFLLLAGVSAAGRPAPQEGARDPVSETVTSAEAPSPASDLAAAIKVHAEGLADATLEEALGRFYAERAWEPVWIGRSWILKRLKLRDPHTRALLEVLGDAKRHGLSPDDYALEELRHRLDRLPRLGRMAPGELAKLEVDLTHVYAAYADDLLHGRLSPSEIEGSWHLGQQTRELSAILADALDDPRRIARTAERLAPDHAGYHRLQDAYGRYRDLAADGGWPEVPEGEVIKLGETMQPERYQALVERLRAQGYMPPDVADRSLRHLERWRAEQKAGNTASADAADRSDGTGGGDGAGAAESLEPTFDEELEAALVRFQESHGIREDGALGPNTMWELNVSAEERVHVIALNLERWRWLTDDLGERYVEVNLPGLTLYAVDGERVSEQMAVVVGKEGWGTPILSETMEYVVVNPYWNIPESILEADILPKLRQNPAYLVEQNMEVVKPGSDEPVAVSVAELASGNYRVRQKPGPENALGRIKFIFPNRHNVYLHDTPGDYAFERAYRDLSHGCVRVERPIALADFVFAGDARWDGSEIERLIQTREHQAIPLERDIPVYFLYWTAFVPEGGEVQFRPDLYGYDVKHTAALERRGEISRTTPISSP